MFEQFFICNRCLNRRVRFWTINGVVHEGVIVGVDEQNVYLDTSAYSQAVVSSKKANKKVKTSAFGFGFGGAILSLALFDLLAIALI